MSKIVLFLALLFLFFCQFSNKVDAGIKFVYKRCENPNYTNNNLYEQNLHSMFDKLTTVASTTMFSNHTVGDAETNDEVFGLYQCRYDLSLDVCSECVKGAAKRIIDDCPSSREAIVWYDECMLRYANRNIFSSLDTTPSRYIRGPVNVTNNDEFIEFARVLERSMNKVIENASSRLPRVASGKTNLSSEFNKLYSFAQCTPDLDASECSHCLETAFSQFSTCCNTSTDAWAFLPSCLLWYARKPFLRDVSFQDVDKGPSKTSSLIIPAIAASISIGLIVLIAVFVICFCRKKPKEANCDDLHDNIQDFGDAEFKQFKFETLKIATRDFSDENKLGEGGFGIVYKGMNNDGQQIAIKRLSGGTTRQRSKEFKTEARLLAKLQHRNLVKLLGICIERDEKLLVYEFMANSSLDVFLFDPTKRSLLDWETRSKIITGIARGLQYLHEDSRLTIIHRDLKPGNILLDTCMIPKIADFGLARLSDADEKFGNTLRIAGTRGYMAPEYLISGNYSDKTDVYSFGIVLLEIVSGQRNRIIHPTSQPEDLSIQAWRLWNEGRSYEIKDPILLNNCPNNEVTRCIQIGLLCVQANAEQRPTMTKVVLMLTCPIDLPLPSTPIMSSDQYSMRINYVSGQQSDGDRSSTKSIELTDDGITLPR